MTHIESSRLRYLIDALLVSPGYANRLLETAWGDGGSTEHYCVFIARLEKVHTNTSALKKECYKIRKEIS